MIRIKKIEIENYRSCLKSSLELQNDLTCLIGINGVGKTNLLNGIQLLKKLKGGQLQVGSEVPKTYTGSTAHLSVALMYNNKEINIKCEIRYETDDRNVDEVSQTDFKFNFQKLTGEKKWIQLPFGLLDYLEQFSSLKDNAQVRTFFNIPRFPNQREQELISELRVFFKKMSYYSASQFSDPTKCPLSIELEEGRPSRHSRSGVYHEKFITDLYLTYKNNNKLFNKFLSTVNHEGIGIIENISFIEYDMPSSSYEVKSGGKIKKIERNRQLVIPNVTIDSIQLSPNQLSEGTFKTLALIFYVITDENNLLLIEEPEVCVHHGLLNSILSLILSQANKKQIIISTHSDFVLDRLKPSNLLIVKKQPRKGTTAKPLSKSLSRNDFQALKNYLTETGNLGEYWKEGGFESE